MMKHLKSVSLAILLMAAFVACKKDSEPAVFTMTGKWIGALGLNNDVPSGYYALNIKSNGTVERIDSDGDVNATGTWTLEGEEFTALYTYPGGTIVNVEGTVDKSQKKLTGNWENSGDEVGTFYATRNN
jgi:hypothetical protein